ncbi:hypothetical protein MMC10_003527 [Thelotrema lepadinum]|nr:hypothetical protein [Thelotrema lepadinum]
MKAQAFLYAAWLFAVGSIALPLSTESINTREEMDEDDKVVYSWSVPMTKEEVEMKIKREEMDEDDKVVYSWSVPMGEGK